MPDEDKLFATTRWNVVLEAADSRAPFAVEALNELCRIYWKPLYSYVRRCGSGPEDAEDSTQGFLTHLLANHALRTVTPLKGKFRSFLLASLKNYLANERDKTQTQKRGGGQIIIALDDATVEQSYLREPVDQLTPEKAYERRWAHTVLEQARQKLAEEYALASKADRFRFLAAYLPGENRTFTQAAAASELEMTEGAFRVEVHRLRQRFGALLREEVAHTVSSAEEIDEELRHLIAIVSE